LDQMEGLQQILLYNSKSMASELMPFYHPLYYPYMGGKYHPPNSKEKEQYGVPITLAEVKMRKKKNLRRKVLAPKENLVRKKQKR